MNVECSDGLVTGVKQEQLLRCQTLKNMLSDMDEADLEALIIPVPNVTTDIFKLVLDFLEHCPKETPTETPEQNNAAAMETWADKLQDDKQMVHDLVWAANYLDIPDLYRLSCKVFMKKYVAPELMLPGGPELIRQQYFPDCPAYSEEEKQIIEEQNKILMEGVKAE